MVLPFITQQSICEFSFVNYIYIYIICGFFSLLAALLTVTAGVSALYDSSDDVVELTGGNFNRLVVNSEDIWLVEFYAPWYVHCIYILCAII